MREGRPSLELREKLFIERDKSLAPAVGLCSLRAAGGKKFFIGVAREKFEEGRFFKFFQKVRLFLI